MGIWYKKNPIKVDRRFTDDETLSWFNDQVFSPAQQAAREWRIFLNQVGAAARFTHMLRLRIHTRQRTLIFVRSYKGRFTDLLQIFLNPIRLQSESYLYSYCISPLDNWECIEIIILFRGGPDTWDAAYFRSRWNKLVEVPGDTSVELLTPLPGSDGSAIFELFFILRQPDAFRRLKELLGKQTAKNFFPVGGTTKFKIPILQAFRRVEMHFKTFGPSD